MIAWEWCAICPCCKRPAFDTLKRASRTASRQLIAQVDPKILQEVYDHVSSTCENMQEYVSSWMQYQSLWEISTSAVHARLGDDLSRWVQHADRDQLL